MTERAFVLVPLSEIAPDVRDPVAGKTAAELAASADAAGVRRIKDAGWDGVPGSEGRVRI
jgi:7,8-dihydro-6-hydroxymethylpterin-pyrophosphokinase